MRKEAHDQLSWCLAMIGVFTMLVSPLWAQARLDAGARGAEKRIHSKAPRGGKKPASVRASWYGGTFHGRRSANGEIFDANEFTAAHRTLRLGTKVQVTNPRNGRSIVVEITDRGPFIRGRDLDLSYAAARALGIVRSGVARVEVEVLNDVVDASGSSVPVLVASNAAGVGGAWPRAIVR